VGHAVRTLHTKEVIQCDAQDVDGPCKRLARPVPQVENLRERMPVSEVELSSDHWREHNIQKGDGHAAAGDRMTHVLYVAEEDNTFLGVWLLRVDFTYRVSSYSTGFYSRLRASMS
jgi:hypothetical protein